MYSSVGFFFQVRRAVSSAERSLLKYHTIWASYDVIAKHTCKRPLAQEVFSSGRAKSIPVMLVFDEI